MRPVPGSRPSRTGPGEPIRTMQRGSAPASVTHPSQPPRAPPMRPAMPGRLSAPPTRTAHQRPPTGAAVSVTDPTASSFMAWLRRWSAVSEVTLAEARKANWAERNSPPPCHAEPIRARRRHGEGQASAGWRRPRPSLRCPAGASRRRAAGLAASAVEQRAADFPRAAGRPAERPE